MLSAGTRVGPYEIVSWLGAGGMGEVYRARDTKLGREVALKTLPEELSRQPERLARLRQEARILASLNHPGIATLHGLEDSDSGVPVLVMELVEGESLQDRLQRGRLSPQEALTVGRESALALEAAHQKGVLHRDLKPGNIRILPDGRVKLLDFGLARALRDATLDSRLDTETSPHSEPGAVLGTAPYMSPEQARGQDVDRRSDAWAFGCVLFEMLAGKRAFQGASFSDTLAAVLEHDPDWAALPSDTPAAALRLLRRCLQKDRDKRLRDIGDAGLELAEILAEPAPPLSRGPGQRKAALGRRAWLRVLPGLAALAALVLGLYVGARMAEGHVASFSRLTFRRGVVESARFAADGRTVVYPAAWDGDPVRTFSTRIERPESMRLDLPDAQVEAVAAAEMLLSLDRRLSYFAESTLAWAPLVGGVPRAIAEGVVGADWGPDRSLAIVRKVGERYRLEYPVGRLLHEHDDLLWPPRISPDGERVALFAEEGGGAAVTVVDRTGAKRSLSNGWKWHGPHLAWSPRGNEIWFTASEGGYVHPLRAVTLSGRERVVLRLPGTAFLHDVSADGRVLLSSGSYRNVARCLPPGESRERDVSWFEATRVRDLSDDGKTVLLGEFGAAAGAGPEPAIYLRKLDGSAPVRLGDGSPQFLSRDGRFVAAWNYARTELQIVPIGAGEALRLPLPEMQVTGVSWFPDGKRLFVAARPRADDKGRGYSMGVDTGKLEPLTPENIGCEHGEVSPDGRTLLFGDGGGQTLLQSLADGTTVPVERLRKGDEVLRWGADSRSLLVQSQAPPHARVDRLDLVTGQRQLWREITLPDTTGVILAMADVHVAPTGSYCYTYMQSQTDLYLVEGIR